jgi:hypothetical protein
VTTKDFLKKNQVSAPLRPRLNLLAGDRISPLSIRCFLSLNSSNLKPSARINKRDLTG